MGDLKLSPEVLAALAIPAGVTAFPVIDRQQWLALRKRAVTASAAAALFGVHPYQSAYWLWALKAGVVTEDGVENPAMRRGRLLEPIALQMVREDYPDWSVQACGKYYSETATRLGATPDAIAIRPGFEGFGVVQVKTAGHFAFKKGWRGMDGDVEIPLWIAVQASIEAALTGASWACVAVMALGDGGLDLYVEDVPLRPALMARLRALVADFWRRVDENDPYAPDFGKDAALIARIYSEADEGAEVDLSSNNRIGELLDAREALKARETDGAFAAKARKPIDAEIIHALGNAARGRLADGRVVEAKVTRRGGFTVEPTSFRTVKVKESSHERAHSIQATNHVVPFSGTEPARGRGRKPAARSFDGPF